MGHTAGLDLGVTPGSLVRAEGAGPPAAALPLLTFSGGGLRCFRLCATEDGVTAAAGTGSGGHSPGDPRCLRAGDGQRWDRVR